MAVPRKRKKCCSGFEWLLPAPKACAYGVGCAASLLYTSSVCSEQDQHVLGSIHECMCMQRQLLGGFQWCGAHTGPGPSGTICLSPSFFPGAIIDFAHFFHTVAGFALASHLVFFSFLCSISTAACPLEDARLSRLGCEQAGRCHRKSLAKSRNGFSHESYLHGIRGLIYSPWSNYQAHYSCGAQLGGAREEDPSDLVRPHKQSKKGFGLEAECEPGFSGAFSEAMVLFFSRSLFLQVLWAQACKPLFLA